MSCPLFDFPTVRYPGAYFSNSDLSRMRAVAAQHHVTIHLPPPPSHYPVPAAGGYTFVRLDSPTRDLTDFFRDVDSLPNPQRGTDE